MRRKLAADQVEAIATSTETGRALAQRYGVSNRTISEIRTGRRYVSVRRPIQDNSYLVGDALKRMKALPDKFCPTIVMAPPYNVDDALTPLKYRNWQRQLIAEGCRVAGPEGLIAYRQELRLRGRTLYRFSDIVEHPLPDGWSLRQTIVWDKGSSNNQGGKYPTCLPTTFEYIFLFAGPMWHVPPDAASDARHWGAVWKINRETNNPHPAPFPVELALRCVRLGRGRVLDPFAGSGSTLLAARRLRRPYLGIDLSAESRDKFASRLAAASTPRSRLTALVSYGIGGSHRVTPSRLPTMPLEPPV